MSIKPFISQQLVVKQIAKKIQQVFGKTDNKVFPKFPKHHYITSAPGAGMTY